MTPSDGAPPAPHVWRTLLGDHPATRALRRGQLTSSLIQLDFADVPVPNKAFKRVVRDLEFDVAELALMTFLMARSRGVPLKLFPVVLMARNPLPSLIYCTDRGRLHPTDLPGRRVGVRAYTTTTAVWTRALLADRFGIDPDRVEWVTCEEGHVAGVDDPPNVRRDPASANLVAMLLDGAIDAAIVDPVPNDSRIAPVVPDPVAACDEWQRRTGARTINHMVVVRESLAADGDRMRELFKLFRESRNMGDAAGDAALPPAGFSPNRRTLEVAIAAAEAQHLLARRLTPDDLVTSELASLV